MLPTGGSTQISATVFEPGGTPVQNGTSASAYDQRSGRVDPVEVQTRNGIATDDVPTPATCRARRTVEGHVGSARRRRRRAAATTTTAVQSGADRSSVPAAVDCRHRRPLPALDRCRPPAARWTSSRPVVTAPGIAGPCPVLRCRSALTGWNALVVARGDRRQRAAVKTRLTTDANATVNRRGRWHQNRHRRDPGAQPGADADREPDCDRAALRHRFAPAVTFTATVRQQHGAWAHRFR